MKVWMVTEEVVGEQDQYVLYRSRGGAEAHVREYAKEWDVVLEGEPTTDDQILADEFASTDDYFGFDAIGSADIRCEARATEVLE